MQKIVIFLNGKEEKKLEKISLLMARDPEIQARIILVNEIERMALIAEEKNVKLSTVLN